MKTFSQQQLFFKSNASKDPAFRIAQLRKLRNLLKAHEQELYQAIYEDFGKSEFDTYVTELSIVYSEISLFIRKLRKWSGRKRVGSGLANFPASAYIIPEPLGTVLVIGAWNYPYQLTLLPALTAMAAGNTVIIKPSELPTRTSKVLAELINPNFEPEYLHVIEGGIAETTKLLDLPFDKIFFTGSTPVGRIVYQAAAKNLVPVTLELGGKSPCFVMKDSPMAMTAKRIVWAKFVNAGQTCVAPDYILVEKAAEEALLEALKKEIQTVYAEVSIEGEPAENYLRIIHEKHFNRLLKFIDKEKVYIGGEADIASRIIEPTVLRDISFEDEVMKEEIFGPVLPVLSFESLDEAIASVKDRPKPLSAYVYSRNRKQIDRILKEVSFGGGAVNESVMHLSVEKLPFGGIGHSGMGSYHGKAGFDNFTHFKSILDKPFWFEAPIKYAPYSELKKKVISMLMD